MNEFRESALAGLNAVIVDIEAVDRSVKLGNVTFDSLHLPAELELEAEKIVQMARLNGATVLYESAREDGWTIWSRAHFSASLTVLLWIFRGLVSKFELSTGSEPKEEKFDELA